MSTDTITLSTVLNRDEADEASPLTLVGRLDPTARGTFDQRVLKSGQSVTAYKDERFKASLADVSSVDDVDTLEDMLHDMLSDALNETGADFKAAGIHAFIVAAGEFATDLQAAFDKRGMELDSFFYPDTKPEILSTADSLPALRAGMETFLETYKGCERDLWATLYSAVSKFAEKYPKAFATPPTKMADLPPMTTINGSDELLRQIDMLPDTLQYAGYEMLVAYVKESSKLAYRPYSELGQ